MRVERVWLPRRIDHPDLNDSQRATLARLVKAYGLPFAFSVVATAALPAWQNIGAVSIAVDDAARKVHNGEVV